MVSEAQKTTRRADSSDAAYLVVREGSRWTDVYQLVPGRRVTIGRGSDNQIVIRSNQCSRHHAELFQQTGNWAIRDLGSRNGTIVNDQRIERDHPLVPGQTIRVAGCHLVFVRDINEILSSEEQAGRKTPRRHSEEQQTAEDIDADLITHRLAQPRVLDPTSMQDPASGASLYRITYEIAQAEDLTTACTTTLDSLLKHAGLSSGAIWLQPRLSGEEASSDDETQLDRDGGLRRVIARSREGRGYHPAPQMVVRNVMQRGEAVLARNIHGDEQLALPDSEGELSTTAALLVPIRSGRQVLGLVHLYSTDRERPPTAELLEFSLSIANHLGPALDHLAAQHSLSKRLDRSQRRIDQLNEQLHSNSKIVGKSTAILQVRDAIERAGPTGSTVLVRGESGVGKELVAAAIHAASPRRDGPFVCLNCAALSPSLLESELFGHEKGAFTGATERKLGKFEAADGGTLMLDEIGEMSQEIQAKFLRVLEGHPFERVGGNRAIQTDVRVIAATNRDLEQAVRENKFRSDLYFRLHVIELIVPPLRQRGDDVLIIGEYFLKRFAREMGRRIEGFSEDAIERMRRYQWPGNIRELKNAIERAIVLGQGPHISASDLVLTSLQAGEEAEGESADAYQPIPLADLERQHVLATLRHTGGHKSKAASILGVERSTLDRKLKRFGLGPKDWL